MPFGFVTYAAPRAPLDKLLLGDNRNCLHAFDKSISKSQFKYESQFKYDFEIDLSKAYRQLRLPPRISLLLSYVTPVGQFRPITLPEGVRTAPQLFSQVMYQVLRTKYKFGKEVEYYFDNVYDGADTVEELLPNTRVSAASRQSGPAGQPLKV